MDLPSATVPLPHHHPLRGRTSDLLLRLESSKQPSFAYNASVQASTCSASSSRQPPEEEPPAEEGAERRPDVLKLSGYRDQLRDLGTSLLADKYCGLTQLDLSRNALTSLNGLQHLPALKQLSLYYNMVSDISEMARLQHHPELAVLDLRLNPVSAGVSPGAGIGSHGIHRPPATLHTAAGRPPADRTHGLARTQVTHAGPRYRLAVLSAAPKLALLDEREVKGVERQRARAAELQLAGPAGSRADEPSKGGAGGEGGEAAGGRRPPRRAEVDGDTSLPAAFSGAFTELFGADDAGAPPADDEGGSQASEAGYIVPTPRASVEAGWSTPVAVPIEARRRESLEVMAERAAVAARLQSVVGTTGLRPDIPGGLAGLAGPASPRAAARPTTLGTLDTLAELPTAERSSAAVAAAEERGRAEGRAERRALQARHGRHGMGGTAWEARHGRHGIGGPLAPSHAHGPRHSACHSAALLCAAQEEVALLRQQREEEARSTQQTAALVQMLQARR